MPPQTIKTPQKQSAMEMRARGMSYSEIQRIMPIPKSTLSLWLRGVEFSKIHKFRLEKKRLQAGLAAIEERKKERRQEIFEIRRSAAQDIKQITKRELWLSGLLLYWSCSPMRKLNEYREGVRFSNSNPDLIKFFLKWLIEVGSIERDDVMFDLFVSEADKRKISFIISSWVRITDFPLKFFSRIYYLKNKTNHKKSPRFSNLGLVQIRVKRSSLLQRQIDGWINGIIRQYWGMSERERQRR